jgi:hypothetical protein
LAQCKNVRCYLKNKVKRSGGMIQAVQHLPYKHETLSSNPSKREAETAREGLLWFIVLEAPVCDHTDPLLSGLCGRVWMAMAHLVWQNNLLTSWPGSKKETGKGRASQYLHVPASNDLKTFHQAPPLKSPITFQ